MNTAKSLAIALAAGAALLSQAASAQLAPTDVLAGVNLADLRDAVQRSGGVVTQEAPNGAVALEARAANGLTYIVTGTACSEAGATGCQAVMLQAQFTMNDKVTEQTVNQANRRFAAVSAWLNRDTQTLGITRYILLSDGVTRQNLVRNIQLMTELVPASAAIALGNSR